MLPDLETLARANENLRMYMLTANGMWEFLDNPQDRTEFNYARGGDKIGLEIWKKYNCLPIYLKISGALPSEIR